jgi:protein tyrosine phosphatase
MGRCNKSIIGCQAPVKKSVVKFWQMIWENKTTLMVMVCPYIGPKGEESFKYCNDLEQVGDETEIEEHFSLKLLKVEKRNEGRVIHRQFELNLIGSYEKKKAGEFEIANY